MSELLINELTGVVTQKIGDTVFELKASIRNVAELQSRLGVVGLRQMQEMILSQDARAVLHGLQALCVSKNADKANDLLFAKHGLTIITLVSTALTAGMPDPEKDNEDQDAFDFGGDDLLEGK